jgi:hypothetical protein
MIPRYPAFKAFEPTESERGFVQAMSGARMSADEICKVIGSGRDRGKPIAKTTLYRHFRTEMQNGQAMLKALVMGRYRMWDHDHLTTEGSELVAKQFNNPSLLR